MNKGGVANFNLPAHFNTALLVVEGNIKVNGISEVKTDHMVLFENNGEDFQIEALEKATVLVLSGEPIHEPIAAQGPFVMNTRAEIMEAINDYNMGKFGYLD
ncbi:MAG: pirin-like C-terminal cupin domain-containing protein [Chitinophagales bacterium]